MIKNVVLALVILTVALSAVGCDYNWGFGQGKKNIEITSTHTDPFSRGEAIAVIQKWFLEQVPNGECRKVLWSEEIEWSDAESFKKKCETIKESYFGKKEVTADKLDDVAADGNSIPEDLSNAMAAYTAAISKTKDINLSVV